MMDATSPSRGSDEPADVENALARLDDSKGLNAHVRTSASASIFDLVRSQWSAVPFRPLVRNN